MKATIKSLVLVVVLMLSAFVSAQDIIITTDERKIEAKIVEVSKSEIRYKEIGDLEGPTFVLSTKEINSILYSSGKVTVFKHTPTAPEFKNNGARITKTDDFYYLGDTRLTEAEYLSFIRLNCPEAWVSYVKGRRLWANGWCLFGLGLGATFGLGVPLTVAGSRDARYNGRYGMLASGCTFLTLGCLATTACIPCLIVGGIKKNNSHEVYNEVCATKERAALELDFQAGQNGMGLALKF